VGCTHFQTCTDDAEMCDMTREEMKEIGTKIVELEEKLKMFNTRLMSFVNNL
jgi:hypothetical protein